MARHRGTELFLARDRWLALPEWPATALSSEQNEGRERGALAIAALFLVLMALHAVESTAVLIGRLFRTFSDAGNRSTTPADDNTPARAPRQDATAGI